ncbi:MAG: 4-hydroxy-3-methylbut-2-enyl diphosphate reductase [Verrucomicrobiota bacterium]|nr:4-hydroxy-3-methylbut-2-enyl diphosphate reductase [Verrucomicrobiota bacterium]
MSDRAGNRRVIVVNPHGFCSGVARAVAATEAALRLRQEPIYCFNEIVHNRRIVDDLSRRGVVFVRNVADAPDGATILFSAHGVSPAVRRESEARKLRVIDATCPFVAKVHAEVRRYAREDYTIFLVGHRRHEEVVGVAGEAPDRVVVLETEDEAIRAQPRDPSRVAAVTQTTLSVEAARSVLAIVRERFPALKTPARSDICYATQNRQQAVLALAARAELILVFGSANSSNSRRLAEVAIAAGCRSLLIGDLAELRSVALVAAQTIGVTSGASTPEPFLDEALKELAARGFDQVESLTVVEEDNLRFPLPRELRARAAENGRMKRRRP